MLLTNRMPLLGLSVARYLAVHKQEHQRSERDPGQEGRGAWVEVHTDHVLVVVGVAWLACEAFIVRGGLEALATVWNDARSAVQSHILLRGSNKSYQIKNAV